MNKKLLKEIREELVKCKTEQDHLWKQTSDWQRSSHIHYADHYGHPEDWIGCPVTYESATFECQNCGKVKILRR